MKSPFITEQHLKAINIQDLPPEAWTIVLGTGESADVRKFYEAVPWLYRGIEFVAARLSNLPFTILRGDEEIDSSQDYENRVKFLPNLKRLLWLTGAGLTLNGRVYLINEGTPRMPELRHLAARTITPVFSETDGLLGFERAIKGARMSINAEQMIYLWRPDPDVEIGPPEAWPAKAAVLSSGVINSKDEFVKTFFERGAIKTTILGIEGNPTPAERERIESRWGQMMQGIASAWRKAVFNTGKVTPTVVGEGLEGLTNTALTNEAREDISTALGVPRSVLFSDEANFATAEQHVKNFYQNTLDPLAQFIAETLNEQLLGPLGYRLRFDMQTLDIFQEDEEDRSGAYLNYVNAWIAAGFSGTLAAAVWGDALGLELPTWFEHGDWETVARMEIEAPPPVEIVTPTFEEGIPIAASTSDDENKSMIDVDLDKWKRKAENALKKGKLAAVTFDSDHIPQSLVSAIFGALECATSPVAVGNIFEDAGRWKFYP